VRGSAGEFEQFAHLQTISSASALRVFQDIVSGRHHRFDSVEGISSVLWASSHHAEWEISALLICLEMAISSGTR
jgi:hypothetical protein